MILLRQRTYSSAETDFDKASKLIHNYETESGGTKHSSNDFKNGLEKYDEEEDWDDPKYTNVSFQAKKGSKLYNTYGPNYYWTLRKDKKTGKCEFLWAGD